VGQPDRAVSPREIALLDGPARGQMAAERHDDLVRHRDHPVSRALAIPNDEGAVFEVEVLDPQPDHLAQS